MTWEEKLEALEALVGWDEISLKMRQPGDWYVATRGRDIGGDGFLSGTYGNGATPQEAVENDWEQVTNLPSDKYIVLNAGGENRRHVRWNGYMWKDLPLVEKNG